MQLGLRTYCVPGGQHLSRCTPESTGMQIIPVGAPRLSHLQMKELRAQDHSGRSWSHTEYGHTEHKPTCFMTAGCTSFFHVLMRTLPSPSCCETHGSSRAPKDPRQVSLVVRGVLQTTPSWQTQGTVGPSRGSRCPQCAGISTLLLSVLPCLALCWPNPSPPSQGS